MVVQIVDYTLPTSSWRLPSLPTSSHHLHHNIYTAPFYRNKIFIPPSKLPIPPTLRIYMQIYPPITTPSNHNVQSWINPNHRYSIVIPHYAYNSPSSIITLYHVKPHHYFQFVDTDHMLPLYIRTINHVHLNLYIIYITPKLITSVNRSSITVVQPEPPISV